MHNMTMTENDFIRHEMEVWDEEYVTNLLNAGYKAILTTAGWKWVLPLTAPIEVGASNTNM